MAVLNRREICRILDLPPRCSDEALNGTLHTIAGHATQARAEAGYHDDRDADGRDG